MREGASKGVFRKPQEEILIGWENGKHAGGAVKRIPASETVWKNSEFYDEAGRVKSVGLDQEQPIVNGGDVISLEDFKARHDGDGRQSATKTVKGDPKSLRKHGRGHEVRAFGGR